ncbi:TPA: hypothetical protein DCY43_00680 [candidate division WWE3 bacterium]|uniref:Nucleoside phosphorylase domain-containing protein n=3 Tax=Katanobacteria TaxID=422282 RepID=A0A0G1MVA6_UNCKA|nr:MAG: hypothetical protein UW36_C0001G0075 [candidate division WWE3 bacterium GW2011_GWA2_44_16]KKT84687.1 MAG: hypothetical protein UW82_C0013G0009 [candidate division WWE3 bacterium GW2011_GWC2_44_9]HAZ29256.1 hypothetical protein [candidate division WWE3 bacterium]
MKIYNCGTGESFIDPSTRYEQIVYYPKICILTHNHRYQKLLRLRGIEGAEKYDKDVCIIYNATRILLTNAREGCTSTHKAMVSSYFKGSRVFVNIGSAGGIAANLHIGDIVLSTHVIGDTGFSRSLMKADTETANATLLAASKPLVELFKSRVQISGPTWCVPTLYYHKDLLAHRMALKPIAVEMEMEAVVSTGMWLNYNYGSEKGTCSYTGLFYISDLLPSGNSEWTDTLRNESLLTKCKENLLQTVLETLYIKSNSYEYQTNLR